MVNAFSNSLSSVSATLPSPFACVGNGHRVLLANMSASSGATQAPSSGNRIVLLQGEGSPRTRAVDDLVGRVYKEAFGIAPSSDISNLRNKGVALTLAIFHDTAPVCTATLRFDGIKGLAAETAYGKEIKAFREEGAQFVEITRLASNPDMASNQKSRPPVLDLLCAAALVATSLPRPPTHVVMEAHPRHGNLYQRMLGFKKVGEETTCPRVNRPAVLLVGNIQEVTRKLMEACALTPWEQVRIIQNLVKPAIKNITHGNRHATPLAARPANEKEWYWRRRQPL